MNLDDEVIKLQEIVTAKKDRIEKLESRFTPETTCSYRRYDGDNVQNLQTKSPADLFNILLEIYSKYILHNDLNKLLETSFAFKHQGYTFEQWKGDVKFLIDKHSIKEMKKDLEEDVELLDGMLSPEMKIKLKFDKMKNKHGL